MAKIRIRWYCGHYVGPMKWQGTEDYEPDECETEFDTDVDKEEWNAGEAEATCPHCGAKLYQSEDESWVLKVEEHDGV